MAISNGAAWEIRSTATAGNVNGGGFIPGASGTDFSQQNAAQYNLTGATSAGAGNVILHASAAADMVGNILHVISGTNFTAGWFEITSVVVGVSITVGTNNAGTAVSTGVGATGVINIGGALSLGSTDDAVFENGTPGSTFWIKGGTSITYTLGGTISIAAAGTVSLPIRITGYNSTRGDDPAGSTRPTFDCGLVRFTMGAAWNITSIIFTSSVATSTLAGAATCRLIRCMVANTSTTSTAAACTNIPFIYRCRFVSRRGIGYSSSGQVTAKNCVFHDSDIGFQATGTGNNYDINECIFDSMVSKAIDLPAVAVGGKVVISDCTLYGSEAKIGIGVSIPTGAGPISIVNCTISGFTTGVSHADVQTMGFDSFNNYFNNTADVSNWVKGSDATAIDPTFSNATQVTGTTATTSGGTLVDTGKDFVTAGVVANQDYVYVISGTGVTVGKYLVTAVATTVLTTAPAMTNNATADKVYSVNLGHDFRVGVTMKAAGYPGLLPGGFSRSYKEQGAVQRQEDYPTAAQVLLSTSFGNGAYTGTRRDAATSKVELAYVYGPGDTFTGTVRAAPANKVELAYAYGPSDATTGTVRAAISSKVELAYAYGPSDATIGTVRAATAAQVLLGTAFGPSDATTGTRRDAPVTTVLSTQAYGPGDTFTGTYVATIAGTTKTGTAFGAAGALTGTYAGLDRNSDPGESNVKLGVTYKSDSTSDNKTGTYDPSPSSGGPTRWGSGNFHHG